MIPMRTQLSLLSRLAAFTQAYPKLTPCDEAFADWLLNDWLLQAVWSQDSLDAKDKKKKLNDGQEKQMKALQPNVGMLGELEKVE